ncbi:hypothetical protein JCM8097_008405 [Rhodosporidiobolus ruineniae]
MARPTEHTPLIPRPGGADYEQYASRQGGGRGKSIWPISPPAHGEAEHDLAAFEQFYRTHSLVFPHGHPANDFHIVPEAESVTILKQLFTFDDHRFGHYLTPALTNLALTARGHPWAATLGNTGRLADSPTAWARMVLAGLVDRVKVMMGEEEREGRGMFRRWKVGVRLVDGWQTNEDHQWPDAVRVVFQAEQPHPADYHDPRAVPVLPLTERSHLDVVYEGRDHLPLHDRWLPSRRSFLSPSPSPTRTYLSLHWSTAGRSSRLALSFPRREALEFSFLPQLAAEGRRESEGWEYSEMGVRCEFRNPVLGTEVLEVGKRREGERGMGRRVFA